MAKVYRADETFDRNLLAGASVAFGVFDGVHRGHQFLIDEACGTAHKSGGISAVLTFDIDPDERFHPNRLKKLMSNERRIKELSQTGVDAVVVLPFTTDFASQEPSAFLDSLFRGAVPYAMHVGSDFRFGARASGTVANLESWAAHCGMHVCAHDLESADGKPITATRIRLLLADGECEQAIALLGHPYEFEGTVEKGRGKGSDMGFATANVTLPAMMQVLGEAVYAAWVTVDGKRYKAAMSVGIAPTFAEAHANCEVHILDFSGQIYGDTILVEPVCRLRPMIKFDSVDELIATVNSNIQWVRDNL